MRLRVEGSWFKASPRKLFVRLEKTRAKWSIGVTQVKELKSQSHQ
jgi:hypothetical protein